MKTLNLKQADDKTFCLFAWDSSKKTFTQIASGRIARELSEGNWFLMGNDSTDLAVYHLFDNDVRVFPVHVENAEIINGMSATGCGIVLSEPKKCCWAKSAACRFQREKCAA